MRQGHIIVFRRIARGCFFGEPPDVISFFPSRRCGSLRDYGVAGRGGPSRRCGSVRDYDAAGRGGGGGGLVKACFSGRHFASAQIMRCAAN